MAPPTTFQDSKLLHIVSTFTPYFRMGLRTGVYVLFPSPPLPPPDREKKVAPPKSTGSTSVVPLTVT